MRIILHVDMNSYFASVEQQANPFLRGRSVGVCAYLSKNGTILASSKEAKAKGVRTGMSMADAKVLDPKIVFVENEPAKYRVVTARIFAILAEYTDKFEPYSIDEAFIDLYNTVDTYEQAEAIGHEIQERILKEVGEWLRCSVGISWTKFLAKFAGDTAPKGGILSIRPDNLEACLEKPVTEAWGIATAMERRLGLLGIRTLNELRRFDAIRLKKTLGLYGYYLWANVNGQEISVVTKGSVPPKSIGHSYCIPQRTTDRDYLDKILYKLCEKTGRRLRERGFEASRVSVQAGLTSGDSCGHGERLAEKVFTTEEIFAVVMKQFDRFELTASVRMLAVSVSGLAPLSGQLSIFGGNTKGRELSKALDKINNRFGDYTVRRGAMLGAENMAHDRIGFRKTVAFTPVD
jgi:DNA polymerase-4